jgi:hypothetical protein
MCNGSQLGGPGAVYPFIGIGLDGFRPAFNSVAINGQSGYKKWPKANPGQFHGSEGPGLARYGHIEWRKEAYGYQMAK